MADEVTAKSSMLETLKAYRDLAIGLGALIAALAGILKPTDTTATEQSFDHTQAALKQLAADNDQTHTDLVRLHKFIVSYVAKHNELEQLELKTMQETTVAAPVQHTARRSRVRLPAAGAPEAPVAPEVPEMSQTAQQIIEEFPTLPEITSKTSNFKEKSFEDVINE